MKTEEQKLNIIISKNIRTARRLREFTLKDVSKVLGITGQQVQKYETGASVISVSKLVILAKYFDVPITFFFEEFKINFPKG